MLVSIMAKHTDEPHYGQFWLRDGRRAVGAYMLLCDDTDDDVVVQIAIAEDEWCRPDFQRALYVREADVLACTPDYTFEAGVVRERAA
ncbi:hypothetical protein F1188_16155 [Roseospira marina]|uniref:Uncharacterized protein n=1 Tax=Roseospira marina TaxID=140057 RepID=A0A5M6I885_9PROT|nr:hypothetical protein [Roseospira marina]KAA5604393.1 hypothetical protein F1188_16155 [Roseospira marina]MBB4315418.1 hypothetical protein [Roseospira marina]MBB5088437.1 hypothetical protein [Roseospira marina]